MKEENKKQTIPQSKEWSLSIECFNNEKNEYDLTLKDLIERIKHETHYYFGITHDKDYNEHGEIRKPHIHIVIKLKAKKTLNGILKTFSKLLEIDRNRISAQITRSQSLMIRYLMHLDQKEKEPYPQFLIETNREDILNQAIKGEEEREDLTAENLIITIEKHGGNRLKIMSEIGLKNYTRFRGTIADIIEELEMERTQRKAINHAREHIETARDIANQTIKKANQEINKAINERIKEVEEKVINNKAVELLNKKNNRR